MEPTADEIYRAYGGIPTNWPACIHCGRTYHGSNTTPHNVGYGVYKDFPCHVHCERERERNRQSE